MSETVQEDIPGLVPYPETADIETSSDRYAQRFAGSVGAMLLDVQERMLMSLLDEHTPGETVLDVGGGHGQTAAPVCRRGHQVTVLGSHPDCARRLEDVLDEKTCRFVTGDVLRLPFEDRSFDLAICFRLLTHCRAWRLLIGELCRVARKAVIVDYPSAQSLNALSPFFFQWKLKVEKDTRNWTSFQHLEVQEAFARYGFVQHGRRKQFFFPMAFHRMLRCAPLSAATEGLFRATGLTALWGSPVITRMVRTANSPHS